jgi:hypothetical protein
VGDARKLHDEVSGEKLAEALDVVELVGADVVIVELFQDARSSVDWLVCAAR